MNIMAVREGIARVISLMARSKIRVTQRGTGAYVRYTDKGAIDHVNVPFLSEGASEEFVMAVFGFTDHECGHVLFSDPAVIISAHKRGPRVANLHNLIEDVYVERKMAAQFPGSEAHLESVRKYMMEKTTKPAVEKALMEGDMKTVQSYLGMVAFRAWGGQASAADFMADNDYWRHIEDLTASVGEDIADQLCLPEHSEECLHLAERLLRRMLAWEEERAAEAKKAKAAAAGGSAGKSKSGAAREGSRGSATPGGRSSAPEPGSEPEAPAAEPAAEPAAGPDESGSPEPEAEEGEGAGEPEAVSASAELPEVADEEAGEAEEGDAPTDEDTGAAPDPEAGPEADPEAGPEPDDDLPPLSGPADPSGGEDEEGGVASMFDEAPEFDASVAEALSRGAREAAKKSEYHVFSTEWDVVEVAPRCRRADSIEKMDDMTRSMTGLMAKQLQRSMAAKSRTGFIPGQRRGRVNPASLARSATGDDRLFRSKYTATSRRVAASLLIDLSGSMHYADRVGKAAIAAYALSTTLEMLRIEHEVIGFTTRHCPEMEREMEREAEKLRYGRDQALYMPVFKSFTERLTTEVKSRIAALTESPGYLAENPDGEAVQLAAHRLAQRVNAERRILMVLSDGSPACPPGYGLSGHLKRTVRSIEQSGMDVIGVGIQTDAVAEFYSKSVVIHRLDELPGAVVSRISQLLLAP